MEEDRILLSSLGVTSANPEDIERDILAKAENDAGDGSEVGGSTEEEPTDKSEGNDPSSTANQAKLLNKLRAVEFEIDAVASTVEEGKDVASGDDDAKDLFLEEGVREDDESATKLPSRDSTLQRALATDRLKSLKHTKAQLEKQLSGLLNENLSKGIKHDKLLKDLVKEEPKLKRKSKETQKPTKDQGKKKKTVSFNDDVDFDAVLDAASAGFVETERDELVRKGILTPFHKLEGFERRLQQPGTSNEPVPFEEDENDDLVSASVARAAKSISEAAQVRPATKLLDSDALPKLDDAPTFPFQRLKKPLKFPQAKEVEKNKGSKRKKKRPLPDKKWRRRISREEQDVGEGEDVRDDLTSHDEEENQEASEDMDDNDPSYVTLEGGLKIPETIFCKLFDYQKVGVQWLWELHCQRAGGIIGDEMGLGKTVQVLSFLGALHFSNLYEPSIVVCPVTLLRQWRREARRWYSKFHVEILHDSAQDPAYKKKQTKSDGESDDESEGSVDSDYKGNFSSKSRKKWDSLINRVLQSKSGLLITTYEQLRLLGDKLLDIEWGYAVLDEGHRIRNPNAEITLVCKQLQTVHRIIMTGAPIQNKLSELWSLFDFVFPGKLGVLPVLKQSLLSLYLLVDMPMLHHYKYLQPTGAHHVSLEALAGFKKFGSCTCSCAVVLRDLVMPYLLRRMKADVNAHLPKKTEHVLFCSLTAEQRSVYRAFLASSDVEQILDGRNSLYGIDVMRKICNHPDLLDREHSCQNPDYGNPERSGKMKVVAQVLHVWKDQGIVMDGQTPVKQRMALIDEFNNSDDIFIFILTTKVGGLGTNLTGADRVIIFDPDWNPSTDMQARERAWRIGQKKDVTVYRLITRGTIEEKVYHRQIYKHFLTNKILKNPQQRRFFKARDMKDLFTLNDDGESGSTETSNIFGQLSEDVNIVGMKEHKQHKQEHSKAAVSRDAHTASRKGIVQIVSAVNHDAIMNAHDEEKMRLEEQASQVAQRAAEALRKSRMLRSHDGISVPTWTGKSGAAGAPSAVRKKFGSTLNSHLVKSTSEASSSIIAAGAAAGKALTSAELLAKIRGNQEQAVGAGLEHQSGLASSSSNSRRPAVNGTSSSRSSSNVSCVQPEVLIRRICTFIQQRGGSTDSASIVDHFKDQIPSNNLPLFKNLLKEIAKLEKDRNGSRWVLKPEYRKQPLGGLPVDTKATKRAGHEQSERLKRQKQECQFKKFLEILKQVHINLPLVEAIERIPNYAKFLTDIFSKRTRIGEFETVVVTEGCMAMLHNQMPPKLKDLSIFTIPCAIENRYVGKALCDLGASINLMPKFVFRRLGIEKAKPTTVMLQLVDISYVQPDGKIEDILHADDPEECQIIHAATKFSFEVEENCHGKLEEIEDPNDEEQDEAHWMVNRSCKYFEPLNYSGKLELRWSRPLEVVKPFSHGTKFTIDYV
ncbi:Protein CHROMATIN REMODELING 8 [Hibiscus syriacus]|uniref:Protein CHROMATIN REMODELING 8 n=1 Tax=Hibiscus syriacus TaxID=106335 RepID=A0A6A3ATW5_HIBSY|nr:Protein CHROMATIN REMODELING 8 [Hibiscus syriacus]